MDRSLSSPARWTAPAARRSRPRGRWRALLAAAWRRLAMDRDERWLREAHDLAHLERRLRALERDGGAPVLPLDAWR